MGRNKRRIYGEFPNDTSDGISCKNCGCRHSYVIRTVKVGEVIRRTRRCRYCGNNYITTETS